MGLSWLLDILRMLAEQALVAGTFKVSAVVSGFPRSSRNVTPQRTSNAESAAASLRGEDTCTFCNKCSLQGTGRTNQDAEA